MVATIVGLFVGLGGLGYGMQSQTHERIDQLENRVAEQAVELRQVHSIEARFSVLQREIQNLDRLTHVELSDLDRRTADLTLELQQTMRSSQKLLESELQKLAEKLQIEMRLKNAMQGQ